MAERGPILRVGFTTNNITPIGTTASGTGLPTESTTTSFSKQAAVIFDGHDTPSATTGIRSFPFSFAGGAAVAIGYAGPSMVPSVSGNAASFSNANSPITNSNPGTTLPVPQTVTTYYKMTGYYTTGAVYESFVVTGSPTSATTTNPNTGHTLINTFVSQTWTS